jgi:uncharacterized damage-inducible protein DinB
MANTISQALLPEFDMEMANTRKMLMRVPETEGAFLPHPKSMTLRRLAGHVAEMPMWAVMTLGRDELDLRPDGQQTYKAYDLTTTAEALAMFDDNLRQAHALLAGATDETMVRPWTLRDQETVYFTMPKVAVMRSFVMNHMIHHRGQLAVYLRMTNVPVPGMYGPSADEQ